MVAVTLSAMIGSGDDAPSEILRASDGGYVIVGTTNPLGRLERDYLVTVRKDGKTKLFSPVPAFLEKFLLQPKEILEKDVEPLEKLIGIILDDTKSEEHRAKLREVLSGLKALECILRRIIEMEEEEMECVKR